MEVFTAGSESDWLQEGFIGVKIEEIKPYKSQFKNVELEKIEQAIEKAKSLLKKAFAFEGSVKVFVGQHVSY